MNTRKKYAHLSSIFILLALSAFGVAVFLHPSSAALDGSPLDRKSGICIRVVDGDTIDVRLDGRIRRLRLHGVDAPECSQALYDEAKRYVEERILGKTISIVSTRKGRAAWNRMEGVVFFGPGQNDINRELVEHGLAMVDISFCESRWSQEWLPIQELARKEKRGVWTQDGVIPPWEKRAADTRGDAEHRLSRTAMSAPLVGNCKTGVFHRKDCSNSFSKNCVIPFATRGEAIAAGSRPCKTCRP